MNRTNLKATRDHAKWLIETYSLGGSGSSEEGSDYISCGETIMALIDDIVEAEARCLFAHSASSWDETWEETTDSLRDTYRRLTMKELGL